MLIASGTTARLGVWQIDRHGQAKTRVAKVDETLMALGSMMASRYITPF